MKRLPIGIQSFVNIRTEADYYYIDKTRLVAVLADKGKYFFLSRPRRFGKSLFLDTLRQAFLGNKTLFQGLFLEHNWDWNTKYPVLYISLGSGVHENREELRETIRVILKQHAKDYGVTLETINIKDRFFELIQKISAKHNQKVVILIDEYDKPMLDQIDRPELALELREELKNFYSVIKDADAYLKFVFITGVTKFSKVSLFSGLNNLQDITLHEEFSTICGYTHHEMTTTFAERLDGVDLNMVKTWYNGYNFLGEPVYNPFDILLFLDTREFRSYWFETGNPSFLIKLMARNRYPAPKLERMEAFEEILSSFDVDRINLETLLFQTGYLTIKKRDFLGAKIKYTLDFPNLEVKSTLADYVLTYLTDLPVDKTHYQSKLYELLMNGDVMGLKEIFQAFFASIPYDWYRKNDMAGYEAYYASIFYCYFTALGLNVRAEEMTNKGRLDLAVRLNNRIFIFEFKVVEIDKTGKNALEQIKSKRYWERYNTPEFNFHACSDGSKTDITHRTQRPAAKNIYLIGIEFSKDSRNIVNYEWECI